MLGKEVSSTIFKFFGMTRPGIEPRSPGLLANTLPTRPMSHETEAVFTKKVMNNEALINETDIYIYFQEKNKIRSQ